MRNLKKFLALVLAMMMVFSLMVTANAATSFNDDADIDAKYLTAAEVLQNLGIYRGDGTGNMLPNKTFTRAELAGIAYKMGTGDMTDAVANQYKDVAQFTDLKGYEWAAGYINYAYMAQWVHGVNAEQSKFNPGGEVTGYQVLALLLQILGYGKQDEFIGTNWPIFTHAKAQELGILTGLSSSINLNGTIKRQEVAELVFRVMQQPTVTWNLVTGYVKAPTSLAQDRFDLREFTYLNSEITAVNREKGSATLQYTTNSGGTVINETYNIVNANLPWTDIGYSTNFWAVPTERIDKKEYKAVSSIEVRGISASADYGIGTNSLSPLWTNGSIWKLVDIAGLNSTDYHVYYNGVRLYNDQAVLVNDSGNGYWYDYATAEVRYGGTRTAVRDRGTIVGYIMTGGTAVAPANGLYIDLIDTDEAGEVESIVVTEYTVADISAITNTTNTGINGIVPDNYYFESYNLGTTLGSSFAKDTHNAEGPVRRQFSAAKIVSDDDLGVGDLITYVIYNGDVYVTKAPRETGALTRIDNISNMLVGRAYTIGGEQYVPANDEVVNGVYAQDYFRGINPGSADIGKKYSVWTDPYGYALRIAEYNDPDQYLYVAYLAHSNIYGIAQAVVVMPDGEVSVVNVQIRNDDDNQALIPGAQHIFRYDINSDGNYVLLDSNMRDTETKLVGTAAYCYYDATFNGVDVTNDISNTTVNLIKNDKIVGYLTNDSIIVDARGVDAKSTSVNVYQGYKSLPGTIYGAKLHCVLDSNHKVVLAYISASDNVTDNSTTFIAYQTFVGAYEKNKGIVNVISGGELKDITLTPAQYATVQYYGVGKYVFNRDGSLKEYTAFPEQWHLVQWQNGTLVVDEDNSGTFNAVAGGLDRAYGYDDNVAFFVLDVNNQTAYPYNPIRGLNDFTGYIDDNARAFVEYSNGKASAIYVIYGTVATAITPSITLPYPQGDGFGKVGYDYYVRDYLITGYNKVPTMNIVVEVDDGITVLYNGTFRKSDLAGAAKTINLADKLKALGKEIDIGNPSTYAQAAYTLTSTGTKSTTGVSSNTLYTTTVTSVTVPQADASSTAYDNIHVVVHLRDASAPADMDLWGKAVDATGGDVSSNAPAALPTISKFAKVTGDNGNYNIAALVGDQTKNNGYYYVVSGGIPLDSNNVEWHFYNRLTGNPAQSDVNDNSSTLGYATAVIKQLDGSKTPYVIFFNDKLADRLDEVVTFLKGCGLTAAQVQTAINAYNGDGSVINVTGAGANLIKAMAKAGYAPVDMFKVSNSSVDNVNQTTAATIKANSTYSNQAIMNGYVEYLVFKNSGVLVADATNGNITVEGTGNKYTVKVPADATSGNIDTFLTSVTGMMESFTSKTYLADGKLSWVATNKVNGTVIENSQTGVVITASALGSSGLWSTVRSDLATWNYVFTVELNGVTVVLTLTRK